MQVVHWFGGVSCLLCQHLLSVLEVQRSTSQGLESPVFQCSWPEPVDQLVGLTYAPLQAGLFHAAYTCFIQLFLPISLKKLCMVVVCRGKRVIS